MTQYLVSARKYRPHKFEDVVGQEQVTKVLKNELKSQQLAQSFLFCGPRGVGKTTCARILAKAINCENPSAEMEPCNQCQSCESFNTNSSFNIHELDAASNNSVEGMRSLTDQVRFAPQAGKYKVYIIDEVHMLSQAAFNAFLKTLEEPPSYAVFILATTEKHKIIPTILSRCQIFDFKRIYVKDIVSHLQHIAKQEGLEAEEAGLHVIAQKADGALRDALSIFDKIASSGFGKITYNTVIENLNILDYDYFFKVTDQLLLQDSSGVLLSFDTVTAKGFEGDTFILGLAEHFRNLLMCKDVATLPLLEVSEDITDFYKTQAALADTSFLLNALDIAAKCDSGYKLARNKRLHVELALLKICYINNLIAVSPQENVEAKKKQPTKALVTATEEYSIKVKPKEVKPEITSAQKPVIKEEMPTEATPSKTAFVPASEITQPTPAKGLLSELQAALKQGKFSVEEQQEAASIEPTQTLVDKAWAQFLIDHNAELPANFISNAKNITPVLETERNIQLKVYSSVAKGFITEQGTVMKTFFRNYFKQNDIQLSIDLQIDESNLPKEKKYLNPKEHFEELAKENPALDTFRKLFDLDIDYDHNG
jgi:DNA polymerase-3 subunit gamma/tau